MAGKAKLTAIEAFEDNLADAKTLVAIAEALDNQRVRRMRAELRERVGEALGIPVKHREALDCIESDELFIVLKPDGLLSKEDLTGDALRPLLRQAVVAVSAAVETYVSDRIMELYGPVIIRDELPPRLGELSMTVGEWHAIERDYQRRRRGLREVVIRHQVEALASASPAVIGKLFSAVDQRDLLKRVDIERGTRKGQSAAQLEEICERRNRIAHTGDRMGLGRATIAVEEVAQYAVRAQEIVEGIEVVTRAET